GQPPVFNQRPVGCVFSPRCEAFQPGLCNARELPLQDVTDSPAVQQVRCARWQELDALDTPAAAPPPPHLGLGAEILRVEALRQYYALPSRGATVWAQGVFALPFGTFLCGQQAAYARANESITFTARQREIVALVGESGCGKSTVARVIVGLETATAGTV